MLQIIQDRARREIKSLDIGKLKARHPDSIRAGMPEPNDARFEPITSEYENVSKFKNTKASTVFKTVTARKELWGEAEP